MYPATMCNIVLPTLPFMGMSVAPAGCLMWTTIIHPDAALVPIESTKKEVKRNSDSVMTPVKWVLMGHDIAGEWLPVEWWVIAPVPVTIYLA